MKGNDWNIEHAHEYRNLFSYLLSSIQYPYFAVCQALTYLVPIENPYTLVCDPTPPDSQKTCTGEPAVTVSGSYGPKSPVHPRTGAFLEDKRGISA